MPIYLHVLSFIDTEKEQSVYETVQIVLISQQALRVYAHYLQEALGKTSKVRRVGQASKCIKQYLISFAVTKTYEK